MNTDIRNEFSKTERVRKAIQNNIFSYDTNEFKTTMTFGVCNSENFQTVHNMIKEADKLLYHVKENGKNCVIYR